MNHTIRPVCTPAQWISNQMCCYQRISGSVLHIHPSFQHRLFFVYSNTSLWLVWILNDKSHNHLYSVLYSKYNLVACRNIFVTMLVVVYKVLAVWNDNSRNWTKSSQISGTMMAAHCMTLSLKLALNWSELSAAPIDITALHWLSTSPLCLCCQWHWSHLKGFQFIPIERWSWTNPSN